MMLSVVLAAGIAGCDSTSGPEQTNVSLRFRYNGALAGSPAAAGPLLSAAFVIEGTDGATLEVTDLWLVVDELKLEREADAYEGLEGPPPELEDQCVRFEAMPMFLDVPTDGDDVGTVQALVPEGAYVSLKLETKAPVAGSALLADIATEFPEWPAQASAVVVGTYTAAGEDPVPFTVYFDAEVKVLLVLPELFVVESGTEAPISVFVDPAIWFVNADGSVHDLSLFDFDPENPQVPKLEAKFEDAVTRIEVGS